MGNVMVREAYHPPSSRAEAWHSDALAVWVILPELRINDAAMQLDIVPNILPF